MDEWTRTIWIFVELLIASLILFCGVLLANVSREIGRTQQLEVDAIEIAKEYRLYNRYDDKEVYPQDIISLILETRGIPNVWVDSVEGGTTSFTLKWDDTIPSNDSRWELNNIASLLPTSATYQSTLEYNANGEVERIEFERN